MTKQSLVKFWIAPASACLLALGVALACAGDWGEEYGTSNFAPEAFVDSSFSPFFLSNQFYYKIGHEESQDQRFNNSNAAAWTAWLGDAAKPEVGFLLEKASAGSIDSTLLFAEGKLSTPSPAFIGASWLQKKSDKKWQAFLGYLQLAKKAELFALNNIEYSWDYDNKKPKATFDATLFNQQAQKGAASGDVFLRQRYWFQWIRSLFFNGEAAEVVQRFKNYPAAFPKNEMYYRCMAYTAGALRQLKNYTQANYYYSLVYANCNALKTAAHYSFHPQEEKDWNATLALCTNANEKATLWQMLGIFYADEQRSMREIYQLDPKSDKIDLLLARAINKYEQKFSSSSELYVPIDSAKLRGTYAFVTNVAASGNTLHPWIWQMAAGYLNFLDKKYALASSWYEKARKSLPEANALAKAQLRLLQLINFIGRTNLADTKLENTILPDLQWLGSRSPSDLPDFRYADALAWVKNTLARKYQKQKELVKSECFVSKTSFYASRKNCELMKAFLLKPGKTPFEQLCADWSAIKAENIFEYQAVQLAFADSIAPAINLMQQAASAATVQLAGNPFNGRINDCHDCDHAAPQKIKYSKLSFLQKLAEMEDKVKAGQEIYTNALLLGNGFYNMSHYGNARYFYEGKIIGESMSSPFYLDSIFRPMLTDMRLATKYYSLALQNASSDEQRAKCQLLLAKCQRNQWYNDYIYSNEKKKYDEGEMINLRALTRFAELRKYSNTQYYREAIKECGYLAMYVR
ncbi:MAG: hypothetical protein KGO82_01135 [Bacteroidota bacterium]|nr:hypothetical protein [Bacteroidota bacterium]